MGLAVAMMVVPALVRVYEVVEQLGRDDDQARVGEHAFGVFPLGVAPLAGGQHAGDQFG
jgi:hypothetical protein